MVPQFFFGKSVLITGASAGIGLELARQLARQGAKLTLVARRLERLEKIAVELKTLGAEVLCVKADVAYDADCETAFRNALDKYACVDVVIANAGFGVSGYFSKLSLDDIRRQMETNLYGVLRISKIAEAPLAQSKGVLVLLGSVAAFASSPGVVAYNMSKAAVRSFAETIDSEWSVKGINVLLVSPGFVDSEIRHLDESGRYQKEIKDPVPSWLVMSAEKAAKQIIKAISQRKAHLIVTGHGKFAVWFSRIFPGVLRWVFRKVAKSQSATL